MIEKISFGLAVFFLFDRILKLVAITHFFQKNQPIAPHIWPNISLIQPITRGAANLKYNLQCRFELEYPAKIQHLLVCDLGDIKSQEICQNIKTQYQTVDIDILTIPSDNIADKIAKMQYGIAEATGEILCFIDDDIALKPNAMKEMIPYLLEPGVGATFGLASAISWNNIWSSLMSAFVNNNALLTYIPVTYIIPPFTITGHIFAVTRKNFDAANGFNNMQQQINDDHELAFRLQDIGLTLKQTPIIYRVSNEFMSFSEYANQIKRWFVFPRQSMIQGLSIKQKIITYAMSLGLFIPSLSALITLIFPSQITLLSLLIILLIHFTVYAYCHLVYLNPLMPINRWPLLLVSAIITPIQVFFTLFSPNNDIIWRGRRLRIAKGGYFEVIE